MAITKKTLMEELDLMVRDDISSQETIIRLSKENKILKDRLDKAIDFIQIYSKHYQDRINHNDLIRIKKLLDILKGEDNE